MFRPLIALPRSGRQTIHKKEHTGKQALTAFPVNDLDHIL